MARPGVRIRSGREHRSGQTSDGSIVYHPSGQQMAHRYNGAGHRHLLSLGTGDTPGHQTVEQHRWRSARREA